MTTVDLNSDLKEGYGQWELGHDEALLGVATSANVACGYHAGDASIMRIVGDEAVWAEVASGAHHENQAEAVVVAVLHYDRDLPVMGLPGSAWLRLAEQAGLTIVREAFADRAHIPEGTLISRREPGAVLLDPDGAVQITRAVRAGLEQARVTIAPFVAR